ncbi:MAG: helix-turn-helix domain-containing protein [Treponema sp.]|jgi:plasmid maintenance system antidote protein VapI|nr:helix-turn-helix domain-containing protein [Treponema sp.]
MSFLRETCGQGGRPYPLDDERRRKVMVALAKQGMTISGLARVLNLPQSLMSMIINGRRISPKTEQRIADFLGQSVDDLFPYRQPDEIITMRQTEAAQRENAA